MNELLKAGIITWFSSIPFGIIFQRFYINEYVSPFAFILLGIGSFLIVMGGFGYQLVKPTRSPPREIDLE